MFLRYFILIISVLLVTVAHAQFDLSKGSVSGNFKLEAQTYRPDSLIGADSVAENMLSNSYMNVIYTKGNFKAGVRFEGYLNTMLGYDADYNGVDIAHRYATYNGDWMEVTAGNYYEQFGNGLVFRSYEDKDLGYDNSMDGARVKLKPVDGVYIKGIIGKQRIYWEKSQGIVRGVDGEFGINEIVPGLAESMARLTIGGSFVSKYQKDENPIYKLPENVGAAAGRLRFNYMGFALIGEYAQKGQDPSSDNRYIYKNGRSLLVNANYSLSGLGILFQYKWVDNMSFRSERDQQLNNLQINYLPAISKNHTYAFAAMYPYATQVNGEAGFQGEVFYRFKRKSALGGKYGMLVSVNYSQSNDIQREKIKADVPVGEKGTDGYTSPFLSMGDELFYRDVNTEISKKFSKKVKGVFTYQNLTYNQGVLEGHGDMVYANTLIADVTFKLKKKHALRTEAQGLFTQDDKGDWAMLLLEYTISPHWFFALSDQYNYGNPDDDQKIHYYSVAAGYTRGSSRVQVSYGKQREGILCVGGVCRAVPAAYGFNISVSSTF